MASGMWTSVSGAAAQSLAVDTIANNLANADSIAFKKDTVAFKEYLSSEEKNHSAPAEHLSSIRDKDINPILDKDQSHVIPIGTYADFTQGPLKSSGRNLDFAIEGKNAFFEVLTPEGIRYTRAGSFEQDDKGNLVTQQGYYVLSQGTVDEGTPEIESGLARRINVRDRSDLSVSPNGSFMSKGSVFAKMQITAFPNLNYLKKIGSSLYANTSRSMNPSEESKGHTIHQHHLEGSNVNPVAEMTNLIKAHRTLEQNLKAMRTYSEMSQKEVNEIAR